MTRTISNILDFINLSWLTGPIFDKELRVASRRKRYYYLRSGYIGLLMILMTSIWGMNVNINQSTTAVFLTSRMAIVGIATVTSIAWLQFIVAQLLAAVLLSTAISDEIYRNTLAVLMTTPITAFQVVIGKIISKLLMVILLLAISFPLLAIVRVFGGISWDFVVLSFCVTLTAAIFTASLSLLLSIFSRKSHSVLLRLILILTVLYAAIPGIAAVLRIQSVSIPSFIDWIIYYGNPFLVMGIYTRNAVAPTAVPVSLTWPIHCAVMLAGTVLMVFLSVILVSKRRFQTASGPKPLILRSSGNIRPVTKDPIRWKELNSGSTRRNRILELASKLIPVVAVIGIYLYCIVQNSLRHSEIHVAFVLGYFFLALLRIALSSSASIVSEKEARTWPILLTTPLENSQIVKGKIIAAIMKARPYWYLIGLHVIVFTLLGQIHFFAILPLALLFALSAYALSSMGVFISSCCRRSSAAVVINMIVFFTCVVPMPFCCINPLPIVGPMVIAGAILGTAVSKHVKGTSVMSLDFIINIGFMEFMISSAIFVVLMLIYFLIAYVLYRAALSKIRRKVF